MDNTDCKSLSEVRSNIDRIDKSIIQLLADRSCYVNQAAKFKKTEQEVEAPNRVEEIINKVRYLAETNSLNPSIAEKVYRTIIGAFIQQEKEIVNNTLLPNFVTPFDHINFRALKLFDKIGPVLDISIAYIDPNGGGPIQSHTHQHSHLFIVLEGEVIIKVENIEKTLNTNNSFLVKGNTHHSVWNVSNLRCIMLGISIIE